MINWEKKTEYIHSKSLEKVYVFTDTHTEEINISKH